jgi:hypothetical protein
MPFTTEQFFNVFREYNIYVFPSQIIILLLGVLSIFLLRKNTILVSSFIKSYIVFLWLWIGIVYQIMFFSTINKAAYIFGALFIIQSILFFVEFFVRKRFEISFDNKFITAAGYSLMIFGAILYPLIGLTLGKPIEYSIVLGLPCPTVIFTFGILALSRKSISKYILIIPVLWSLIGFFAAIKFGVYQDIALPLSAILIIIITSYSRFKK